MYKFIILSSPDTQDMDTMENGVGFYDFGFGNETGYYDVTKTKDGVPCSELESSERAAWKEVEGTMRDPADVCYIGTYATDAFIGRAQNVGLCVCIYLCDFRACVVFAFSLLFVFYHGRIDYQVMCFVFVCAYFFLCLPQAFVSFVFLGSFCCVCVCFCVFVRISFFFFFSSSLLLSSLPRWRFYLVIFWTSRGHRCRPFFPPVLAFNFYGA